MPNIREKLIELRREGEEIAENFCVSRQECCQCPYNTPNGCQEGLIADHLIANGVTVQEWISVKDRLPDSGIEVLAMLQVDKFDGHYSHNVVTGVRMPSDSWLVADYQEGIEAETAGTDCEDCCYWITHWMPLPQPPKGE